MIPDLLPEILEEDNKVKEGKERKKETKEDEGAFSKIITFILLAIVFSPILSFLLSYISDININNNNNNKFGGEIEMVSLFFLGGIIVVLFILFSAIRIVKEYERGVIFRLGRLVGAKGPGIFFLIPIIDKMVLIDLRTVAMDVEKQNVITKDNVSVGVDAVVYYRVSHPENAVVKVENFVLATLLLAQTTLRDILGQVELDDLLSERDKLNKKIQEILDVGTDPWGIKVTGVTIKDVALPDTMLRAIAKQAEAERERRSRIIMADGEFQAAKKMQEAAMLYETTPIAIKLREFQTLTEIAREKNLIISSSSDLGMIAGLTKGILDKKEKSTAVEKEKVKL